MTTTGSHLSFKISKKNSMKRPIFDKAFEK